MDLACPGFLVDCIETNRITGPVPSGMEIASQVPGDISPQFHVKGSQRLALFGFGVKDNQRLLKSAFSVGYKPLLVGREAAVAVEIQKAVAQGLVVAFPVGEQVMAVAAIVPERCDYFIVVSPIEV